MAEKLKIAKGNIGNALHSTAKDHVTTFVDEVFDEDKQKYQSDINDELANKKLDKESILQESGDAEDKVMSQKATTTAIADETTRAKAAEEENATAIAQEKVAIMGTDRIANGAVTNSKIGEDFKNIIPQIADSVDNNLNIADEDGNVLAEFCEGHIRTKEFDSKKIVTDIKVEKSADGKNKLIIKK